MKYSLVLLACTAALSACNKGPDISVKNASVGEVAEKVRAAAGDSSFVQPGRWETKVTVLEVEIPGMPPQLAARMKDSMGRQGASVTTCMTAADLKKPTPELLAGRSKDCRFDHYTMSGGTIDAQMTCSSPQGGSMSVATTGTYSSDEYETTSVMTASGGGRMSGMKTKSHTESHRVGECKGDEDNLAARGNSNAAGK